MYANTLDIANDVLQAAKERARREKKTPEKSFRSSPSRINARTGKHRWQKAEGGLCLRPFPKRGGIVTNELIDKLREDDAY
jgi:hypothetical protein